MNQAVSVDLITELDLGSARGGKAGTREPLSVEVVRALGETDLEALTEPPPVAAQAVTVKSLRHSHHRLAELIVAGKESGEIALVTGYSIPYISNIQNDPAFRELVAYYGAQKESVFVDAMERLRVLGIDGIERLHDKLNDPAQPWSPRELMELVDMAVVKPATAQPRPGSGTPGQPGASLQLEVKFVGARSADGPIVDAKFSEMK